jgi:competence protein ComEC
MSLKIQIPVWKTSPFIRLLFPLSLGVILQWYFKIDIVLSISLLAFFVIIYTLFYLTPLSFRYKFKVTQGIILHAILVCFGLIITWQQDVRHSKNWYGNYTNDNSLIIVKINEPLVEKAKSYKADGMVEGVINNDSVTKCSGKILVYFAKDSATKYLQYGDKILVDKKLQPIKNAGNPGSFNYERYAAFQKMFHNVYLKDDNWIKLQGNSSNAFNHFIFKTRASILAILQKYISTNKDELGIAEALLIGYTNDLDKDLVQAYSNTGVVHIIAISGMHLGLIYVMLVWLFSKMPGIKKSKLVQVIFILSSLWLFTILTGCSASILRSAVMFTCIAIGNNFFIKSSIFNSLAASAFIMLCYNPYFLWDVGFQLSYLAVVGIIVFQKPIYNLLYIKNKYVNEVWKLTAVSLAAQLLTFPVCIYYFHQFPNLFLLTNLIAVPLSSIILYVLIALVALAQIPFLANYIGKLASWLLWLLNQFISWVNSFSFSVWDKISATIFTTWLLYATVICFAVWLLKKKSYTLLIGLSTLLIFVCCHTYINWTIKNQQKLIVYNVPQHQAIDFIKGNNYQFVGDSILLEDGLLQNFHLKPGRISLQLNNRTDYLNNLFHQQQFYQYNNKRIFVLNGNITIDAAKPINLDVLIISKNPKIEIDSIAKIFSCKKIVFDASNSLWKIGKWKLACDKLNLQYHSIPEQGAFVLDIQD